MRAKVRLIFEHFLGDRGGAVYRFRFVASELRRAIDYRFELATLSAGRPEKPECRSVTAVRRLARHLIAFALRKSDFHD